jgi:hypothetical protein
MRTLALYLLFGLPLAAADGVLIVADEIPAMERLAGRLKTATGIASTIVKQAQMPSDLSGYPAVIVYIHGKLEEGAEKAFIGYAGGGGKLILLHHSISTGKRPNRYWLPFLGISLPEGELSAGGYKYFEDIELEIANLAPAHYITTHQVKYESKVSYMSAGGPERDVPAFTLKDAEVYLNQVSQGERTVLLGIKFSEAKSGVTYMQDSAGWYKKAGRGLVLYFMPGHSAREFEHPSYTQILANAVTFKR